MRVNEMSRIYLFFSDKFLYGYRRNVYTARKLISKSALQNERHFDIF